MALAGLVSSGLTIPAAGAINAAASVRALAAAGVRSVVPLTYGMDRRPALLLNVLPKAGDANTLLVQCLWGHALHAVDQLQLNDQALPAGTTVTTYTGEQTTPDAALVAAFAAQGITYTDTLEGFAHSVVAMPTRAFDGQLNVSARIWGRRLYDPRKDSTAGGSGLHRLADPSTWEWSDCPVLATADWLANATYGAGEAVLWSSVPAAANANDTIIGSPGEKRRLIGVTFDKDGVTAQAIAETLRAYAGCWLIPTGSGMRLVADAPGSVAATYRHQDGDIAALDDVTLEDMGNAPTRVEILFTDTTQTPWRESTAFAELDGVGTTIPLRVSTIRMPGIQRYSQALREATERLNKLNLGDLSAAVEVFDIGMRHEPGDIVAISHPIGLVDKPMRVTDSELRGPGRWVLRLKEYDPAAYSDEVQAGPSVPDTSRSMPDGPASAVQSFTATASKGRITWSWKPGSDSNYGATELRAADADWGSVTPAPEFRGAASSYQQVVSEAGTYTLYARHLTDKGTPAAASVQTSVVVTADDLVQDGESLFLNDGGFEVAAASTPWTLTAYGSIVSTTPYEGAQCLRAADNSGAASRDIALNKFFPAVAGARYRFGCALRRGATVPDGSISARIVWRNEAGTFIGSTGVSGVAGSALTTAWAAFSGSGTVPSGATRGRVEVRSANLSTGDFYIDACTVEPDGEPGSDAQTLMLTSTALSFTFGATNAASPASQTVTFVATLANLGGTAAFTCERFDAAGVSLGTVTMGGTGNTRTLTVAQFGTAAYAVVNATLSGFTDQLTVVRLRDGSSGITPTFDNASHTLPAGSDGAVSSYAGSGCKIQVYEGSTALTFHTTLAAGRFVVGTPVVSPGGAITVGARSGSGTTTCTVAVHSAASAAQDVITITYPITARRADGTDVTLDLIQTLTKSKAGTPGTNGLDGLDGADALGAIPAGWVPAAVGGSGDLVFYLNATAPGVGNVGEIYVAGTRFQHPDGVLRTSGLTTVVTTPYGEGVGGRFYLAWSETESAVRFPGLGLSAGANIFPARPAAGGGWEAFSNVGTVAPFTPVPSDCLVAVVEAATSSSGLTAVAPFTSGLAGSSAQLLQLVSTALSFTFSSTNAASPGSQTISFTAVLANLGGTAAFTCERFDASGASLGLVTMGGSGNTRTLTVAQFGVAAYAKITATLDSLTDQLTVVRLRDGSGGITPTIDNASHTLPAANSGAVSSYAGSGCAIQVYEGSTALTFHTTLAAGRFVMGTPVVSPGSAITVGARSGSGTTTCTVAVHSAASAAQDVITITYPITARRADGSDVTFDLVQTLTKGKTGAAGADAQALVLWSTALSFTFGATNVASPASQTISFTAALANLAGTAAFTCERFDAAGASLGTVTMGGSGNTRTLTVAQFSAAAYAIVSATLSGFTDQLTVVRLRDGSGGITPTIDNAAHTLPSANNGAVSSYTGSGCKIQVYEGSTALVFHTTLAAGRFVMGTPTVSPASSITVGARSGSGTTTCTVAAHSGANSAQDVISVSYPITARRADGTDVTFDLVQTLTKSKTGAVGADGTDAVLEFTEFFDATGVTYSNEA